MNRTLRTPSSGAVMVFLALTLVSCGGGGGGGDGSSGGSGATTPPVTTPPTTPPSTPPTTPPTSPPTTPPADPPTTPPAAAIPTASVPLAPGKRWLYDFHSKGTASSSTGVSQSEVDAERLLYVNAAVTWQGRAAWQLTQYDRPKKPQTAGGFTATTLYLVQDTDGLERWVDNGTSGAWKRILSAKSTSISSGTFLMAGAPAQGDGLQETGSTPIAVAAGNFTTVEVSHEATVTGKFAPADIFEKRHEYYADNVGLVSATWSYSVDDNDPQGTDTSSTGSASLVGVDSGIAIVAEVEPNDIGSELGAEGIQVGGLVTGQIEVADPAMVVTDSFLTSAIAASVAANVNGKKAVQDWFRFQTTAADMHHFVLKYATDSGVANHPNALGLYLFRNVPSVGLQFVASSVADPTKATGSGSQYIHVASLPAGSYIIAVQALATPNGMPASYWLSTQ